MENQTMFNSFNFDVLLSVVQGWICKIDGAKLDSAFCNKNDRVLLLKLFESQDLFDADAPDIQPTSCFLQWLNLREIKLKPFHADDESGNTESVHTEVMPSPEQHKHQKSWSEIAHTESGSTDQQPSHTQDHRLRFGCEELFETSLDMDDLNTPITNNATITDKPQLKTLIAILMTENKEWFSNKFCATFLTPGTNPVCLDKYTTTVRLFLDPAWNVDTTYPEYSAYMHTNDMGAPYLELAICMRCIGLAAVPATVCGATGFRVERKAPTQQKPKPDDNTMLVSAITNCVFYTVV